MTEEQSESQTELLSRIDLIESMVREGRRTIEYWGWTQVLWGTAYLIAIGWSQSSHRPQLAWPVSMIVAAIITIFVSSAKKRVQPPTTTGRALRAIWIANGTALFLYCFSIGISGHFELHTVLTGVEVILGVANFSSAMVLGWRVQFGVAIVWWAAAVATCFVRSAWVLPILIAATLLGMIGFGLYLMYRQNRDRRRREIHA